MENSAAGALLQTPIHGWHKSKNAKLADFGGWEMPIEYGDYLNKAGEKGGVLAEHNCVREKVGLFDVSHLGKIEVIGKGALDFLNQILTNDLAKISDGQAQYNMICNDPGGVIDDLILYRRNADDCLLIPNAANCQQVYETLVSKNKSDISITNAHTKYAVIALQGPLTNEVLADLGIILDLEYMSFTTIKLTNNLDLGDVVVCRTGYTGEFGYEFLPDWKNAQAFWNLLEASVVKVGGRVCGLGARDTLRTEMGYPLHGHELSLEISPIQANAGWAVALNKPTFLGSETLKQEKLNGVTRILRGLLMQDRGIPRADMNVKDQSGQHCGVVTSGTFSPTLKNGVALALIDPKVEIGSIVEIDVRGKVSTAKVVKPPFVTSHVR